jgi:hypothetical protein
MNRGYVRLWRKSLDAGWIKNHKLWSFWSYCLMKASYREFDAIIGLQIVHLLPGQFVFGRKAASKETGLTEREIRTILAFLKNQGNLTIKTTNKYSIITIINWVLYQGDHVENDQLNDQPVTSKRPHTNIKAFKKKRTPEEILPEISEMGKRYPDQGTINQAFQAISATRQTKRISDNVKLNILQQWGKYPPDQVMAGIRIYLEKGYASEGKNEKYLLGIIRGNSKRIAPANIPIGKIMKSTGSVALDATYRQQGFKIT